MKPQNYSLKFQNSLADVRITPGSQHGVSRARAHTPNGQRAIRKLTKAEAKKAGIGHVGKKKKNVGKDKASVAAADGGVLRRKIEERLEEKRAEEEYAIKRKEEKERQAKMEVEIKSELIKELDAAFCTNG